MALLVLGDSISAGVGASLPSTLGFAPLLHRNHGATWPAFVGQDLASSRPTFSYINLARSGATTAQVLQRLQIGMRTLPIPFPTRGVVVMTAGGNDLKNTLWQQGMQGTDNLLSLLTAHCLTGAIDNLARITALLQHPSIFPVGLSIYLANIYDPTDGTETAKLPWGPVVLQGLASAIATWNARYAKFSRQSDVHLIDAHAAFLGHGLTARGDGRWLSDWLHPNDAGHHALRDLFLQAILKPTRG